MKEFKWQALSLRKNASMPAESSQADCLKPVTGSYFLLFLIIISLFPSEYLACSWHKKAPDRWQVTKNRDGHKRKNKCSVLGKPHVRFLLFPCFCVYFTLCKRRLQFVQDVPGVMPSVSSCVAVAPTQSCVVRQESEMRLQTSLP